jgi:hypothetical protein
MHAYVSTCYQTGQVPAMAVAETQAPTPRNPRGEALVAELEYEEDHISGMLRTWPGWPFG